MPNHPPINIFITFSDNDRAVRDELLVHLNVVKGTNGWNIWTSKDIQAGAVWDKEIMQNIAKADVFLFLISANFFASDYIKNRELPEIEYRYKSGKCLIIPVFAKYCNWKDNEIFTQFSLGSVQAVPSDTQPLTSASTWSSGDEPYAKSVNLITKAIDNFRKTREKATKLENEKRDHDTFARAKTLRDYENYLKLGHLLHAAEAKKKIEELRKTFGPLPTRKPDSNNSQPQWLLWLIYAALGIVALVILFSLVPYLWPSTPKPNPKPNPIPMDTTLVPTPPKDTTNKVPKDTLKEKIAALTDNPNYPMVVVDGGKFMMGTPTNSAVKESDECPHEQTVASFLIGKFEVTQALWQEIMGNAPSKHTDCPSCPVESINWEEIQTFLKKLNEKTGKNYRLPKENEWEYAARGGSKSKNYLYAGSNQLNEVAWSGLNSGGKTHPVGQKQPNELGIYDLSGNVGEWCDTDAVIYPNCPAKYTPGFKITRGMYYIYGKAPLFRNTNRFPMDPDKKYDFIGLRLAHEK